MSLFRKHTAVERTHTENAEDFGYLSPDAYYFDSACQTLRPAPVLDAVNEYYRQYNACGGRVKYAWGEKVDGIVAKTREQLLKLANKNSRDYTVAFCLNTTAGINLTLQQLPTGRFRRIVTSEIEHNSVFLPTQTCAKRLGLERVVLPRLADGSLDFLPGDLEKAVVVVNTTSNIDGRRLGNLKDLVDAAHARGGVVILDAAQTMAHDAEPLRDGDFDAVCGSSHKMYGPSLGFIIIAKTFLRQLDCFFLGGGTVADVRRDDFDLLDTDEEAFTRLEAGLQDFAGIAGLSAAIEWLGKFRPEPGVAKALYDSLASSDRLKLLNRGPSPILALHSNKVDSHRLALYLSAQNIMVRSGYFCCHYYLKNLKSLPPLLRISVGHHNTTSQAMHAAGVIHQIVNNL